MRARCIWLDGGLVKACRVLRARLEPLGYRVICRFRLPDAEILRLAWLQGCIVATTDKWMSLLARLTGMPVTVVHVPQERVEAKSSRDLATLVIKATLGRR